MLGVTDGVAEFQLGENLDVSSAVQLVIDNYDPTDFAKMNAHRLSDGQQYNPADSPESLLVSGALQENLEAAGIEAEFYTVAGGGHGWFADPMVGELTGMTLAKHLKE